MSYGNQIRDHSLRVTTSAGPGRTGMYSSRVWSGANQASNTSYEEHPYDLSASAWRDSIWTYRYSPLGQDYTATARNMLGTPSYPNPWGPNDDFVLLRRLAAKVKRTDFNAAVSSVEGRESLALIGSSSRRLADGFDLLRKGDIVRAARKWKCRPPRRNLHSVAGNWLEMRYGWMPLINDIYSGAEALADALMRPYRTSVRVGLQRQTNKGTWSFGVPTGFRRVRVGMIVRFDEDISLLQQMGLLDPDVVLWETVPYSFVADWVVPIGAWLETRGVLSALKSGAFIKSVKDETVVSSVSIPATSGLYVQKQPSCYYTSVTFKRTISTKPPEVPFPKVNSLEDMASWQHAADGIALVVSRFGKGRR